MKLVRLETVNPQCAECGAPFEAECCSFEETMKVGYAIFGHSPLYTAVCSQANRRIQVPVITYTAQDYP